MALRHVHYEAAFEDFLRSRGWPYVPVEEHRRAIFSGARVKSFDFLVYPPGKKAWLVDVKGRKFPYEHSGGKRYWENWINREDLDGLSMWSEVFGNEFEPVFVFAYWLLGTRSVPTAPIHPFRGESYVFLKIPIEIYANQARQRSPKWDTLDLSSAVFKAHAAPVEPV